MTDSAGRAEYRARIGHAAFTPLVSRTGNALDSAVSVDHRTIAVWLLSIHMSVIADFTVPAEGLALAETLKATPTMTVELERLVAHSREFVLPFLWVAGQEFDQFEQALDTDSTVQSATVADDFWDIRLYKMQWVGPVVQTVDLILDHEGAILEAEGHDGEWQLKLRFDDREQLTTFQDHFREHGQITLHQLYTAEAPQAGEYNLTQKQRDALVLAFEEGFYDVPRAITATELAEQFDLSQQAFSNRLRRGTTRLIENTLITG